MKGGEEGGGQERRVRRFEKMKGDVEDDRVVLLRIWQFELGLEICVGTFFSVLFS